MTLHKVREGFREGMWRIRRESRVATGTGVYR